VLFCSVLFAIGGQTAGPIGPKIGTNTHWDYAIQIGGRRARVVRNRGGADSARSESTGIEQGGAVGEREARVCDARCTYSAYSTRNTEQNKLLVLYV
jgi:hypothetical protein